MALGRNICKITYTYLLIKKDLELKYAFPEGQLGEKL